MKTYSVDEATQHLWRELDFSSEEGCALWVGSGLSVDHYASWEQTIERLCDACGVPPPTSGATSDALIEKAEVCKRASEERYHETILDLFADRDTTGARQAYNFLWSLEQSAYITTNYDQILYSLSYPPDVNRHIYPDLPSPSLGNPQKKVYYLHGLAERGRNPRFVLSSSEFHEAYEDPGYLNNFLEALFRYKDMLFVGCSLSEPPLRGIFQRVDRIAASLEEHSGDYDTPTRIMLHPVPPAAEDQSVEQSRLETLGVEVVWYEPDRRDVHSELESIFKKLCELNRGKQMGRASVAGP